MTIWSLRKITRLLSLSLWVGSCDEDVGIDGYTLFLRTEKLRGLVCYARVAISCYKVQILE